MFATDSKLGLSNSVLNVWYLITVLKLSGLSGIQEHIKTTRKISKAVPSTFRIHCTLYNPFVLSNTAVKMASLGLHNPISCFMEADI